MLRLALLRYPLFAGDTITRDLDTVDHEWFAGCKRNHLQGLPGKPYEVLRLGLMVWVSGLWTGWFIAANLAAGVAMVLALHHLRRLRCSNRDIVARWQWYVLVRAVAMALLCGIAVAAVPASRLPLLVIAVMLAYGVEAYAQFPLPRAAVASQVLGSAAMTVGLLVRTEALAPALLVLLALQGLSAHLRIANFYYLFATRRLRTHKLKAANETIQMLLNQYDEHGSDCLVETDVAGRVRGASERLCRMTGRAAEAINGRLFVALYEPGPGRDAIVDAATRMKPFRDVVGAVATPDGLRWWLASGCAVFDRHGRHTGFRGFIRDVTDRHHAESRVQFLASHDGLTRIANRAEFHVRLDAAVSRLRHVARHRRSGDEAMADRIAFAVLFIDLDRFKLVNDASGHAAGDRVLVETAARLARVIGERGQVARLGGDEFAVLLRAPETAAAVIGVGEAVIAALSQPIRLDTRVVHVGASIGAALAGVHGMDGDELLRAADLAQYEAKSGGGGRIVIYNSDILRGHTDRERLEVELRLALARGEFVLYYQPVISIATGAIVGFEALIRWNHPQRGLIEPGQFIPLAEATGLIVPIGAWVLREATDEAATWPVHLSIAVNVSALQLRGGEVLRQTIAALSASALDPSRLELEITETVLIENDAQCLDVLHSLRGMGVRIALDDFGTGYSSLNYLRSFPFDKIKIDRCFVSDLSDRVDDPGDSVAIVAAVLDLAVKLNMETIAEGVEDESQLERLRACGCGQVQGWLTGRPMPAASLPIVRVAQRHVGQAQPQAQPQRRRKALIAHRSRQVS